MEKQILQCLLKSDPYFLFNWSPQEWLNLFLVCKSWWQLLGKEVSSAIDWGWDNDLPLRFACQKNHIERVEILLTFPLINPAALGNSSIAVACNQGYTEIARILLADPRVQPGVHCLAIALLQGNIPMAQLLIDSQKLDLKQEIRLPNLDLEKLDALKWKTDLFTVLIIRAGDYPELLLSYCKLCGQQPPLVPLVKFERWQSLDQFIERNYEIFNEKDFYSILEKRLSKDIHSDNLNIWLNCLQKFEIDLDSKLRDLFQSLTNSARNTALFIETCLWKYPNLKLFDKNQLVSQLDQAISKQDATLLLALEQSLANNLDNWTLQMEFEKCLNQDFIQGLEILISFKQIDPSFNNNQAICTAASRDNLEALKLLAKEHGVAIWARNNYALKMACKNNNVEMAKFILSASKKCFFDYDCLIQCTTGNSIELLAYLLSTLTKESNIIIEKLDIFEIGKSNEKLLNLISQSIQESKLNLTLELQKQLIDFCLAHNCPKWLASWIDNRISISKEISILFSQKKFHLVNHSRIDLQNAALNYFKSAVGCLLRPFVTLEMATFMIFTLIKNGEIALVLDAGRHAGDFKDSNIISIEEFHYKLCRQLLKCKSLIKNHFEKFSIIDFFNSISFSQPIGKYIACKSDCQEWVNSQLETGQPILSVNGEEIIIPQFL